MTKNYYRDNIEKKRYYCTACDNAFGHKQYLTNHMNTAKHNPDKIDKRRKFIHLDHYDCVTCMARFKKRRNYTKHLRSRAHLIRINLAL